ncbi:MAG: hypothetical protein NZM29_00145, partial [Nitrospira sp.]|nr:hypothetical protein [Nitrospira sp.]
TCFAKRNNRADAKLIDRWTDKRKVEADFSKTMFFNGADFEKIVFIGRATFAKAKFYETTSFVNIRFWGHWSVRSSCQVSQEPPGEFLPVFNFHGVHIFGSVGFLRSVERHESERERRTNSTLRRSRACACWPYINGAETVRLFEQAFRDRWGRSGTEPLAMDLTNIVVRSRHGLRFHSVNLERCKAVGTNLDACYFNNVRWPRVRSHFPVLALRWGGIWRKAVYGMTSLWCLPAKGVRRLVRSLLVRGGEGGGETGKGKYGHRVLDGIYDHFCLVEEMENQVAPVGKGKPPLWQDGQKAEELAQLSKAYRDLKAAI